MKFALKLSASILIFLTVVVGFPAASFAQQTSSASYVVKLHVPPSVLAEVGSHIQKKFEFSKDPQFDNVYSFQSSLGLPELRSRLADKYAYLESDLPVIAGATETQEPPTPNDPGFSSNPENIDREWGLHKAQFVKAWLTTRGSTRVKVAIIDTGIDQTHEDLRNSSFAPGYNVLTSQDIPLGSNSDDNGHGTLISGVIGATANNGIGITGANWNVTLMPVKALKSDGSGSSSQISEAMVWAADHNANIINLSLGGLGFAHDTTLANAITYAFNKGVVIVAAAGNDVAVTGGNLDKEPVFPICDDNGKNMIIGVTATDVNDLKPDFANFGKACVDVSAPGKRILSTVNHDPVTGQAKPNSYAYASGTSLAVPFVSAQAAMLKAKYPSANNQDIRDRIIFSSDNIDNLNLSQCAGSKCAGLLGGGRINVVKSLEEAFISINDGDVVQATGQDSIYYINGGKRQLISPFVRGQRFAGVVPKTIDALELSRFPEGSYAEPNDGTLVKIPNDPTVYYMQKGLRLPVTYQVFQMRGFKFSDIFTLPNTEVNSWVEGSFLTPPEGTLLRTQRDRTVFWVVGGVLHPINGQFFTDRGLNIFPVVYVSDGDMSKFSKGDPYIL